MEQHSVWLGPLRGPVKLVMLAFLALAFGTAAWLIIGQVFLGSGIGMHQMLRPAGLPSVQLMLWSLLGALVSASIYLSDTVGAIEDQPEGFFDILSLVTSRLAMMAVVFIVLVMFYEVIARYIFNKPTLWAN